MIVPNYTVEKIETIKNPEHVKDWSGKVVDELLKYTISVEGIIPKLYMLSVYKMDRFILDAYVEMESRFYLEKSHGRRI